MSIQSPKCERFRKNQEKIRRNNKLKAITEIKVIKEKGNGELGSQ